MSKALPATCQGGVVTCESVPIPETTILSEGVAPSEGVLILEEEKKTYIAKTSPDLKTTLTELENALGAAASGFSDVVSALTTLGTATGTTLVLAPIIISITASSASINAAKAALTALKGNMK